MSNITWGLNGFRLATLVCSHCGAVFDRDLNFSELMEAKEKVENSHHCTPSKPWDRKPQKPS